MCLCCSVNYMQSHDVLSLTAHRLSPFKDNMIPGTKPIWVDRALRNILPRPAPANTRAPSKFKRNADRMIRFEWRIWLMNDEMIRWNTFQLSGYAGSVLDSLESNPLASSKSCPNCLSVHIPSFVWNEHKLPFTRQSPQSLQLTLEVNFSLFWGLCYA